jgi:hypothetical protein
MKPLSPFYRAKFYAKKLEKQGVPQANLDLVVPAWLAGYRSAMKKDWPESMKKQAEENNRLMADLQGLIKNAKGTS